jgi:hypothetical protein
MNINLFYHSLIKVLITFFYQKMETPEAETIPLQTLNVPPGKTK